MNDLRVILENISKEILEEYSKISIAFTVESEYKIKYINNGLGGIMLEEEKVDSYEVNFDSEDDNPSTLINKFDLSNWMIVSAFVGEQRIGGAIVAFDTKGVNMLEGRKDLAVLWDLRIHENYRQKGIGSAIVNKCLEWAKAKKCNRLKIETQNNNTKACKFYSKQGAVLSNINKYAYKDNPKEVQFIWTIEL